MYKKLISIIYTELLEVGKKKCFLFFFFFSEQTIWTDISQEKKYNWTFKYVKYIQLTLNKC